MENFGKKENYAIDALREQLADAGIDTSLWGTGKAKTLEHLQNEIASGETVLIIGEEGKLLRNLVIGKADILYNSPDGRKYRLKEDRQVFKDGRERRRNLGQAVSEKIKPNEDPKIAIVRGIQEELGISGEIELTKIVEDVEKEISPSYPGLESQYTRQIFRAKLSDEQFKPEGYIEEQSDKSTYFIWEEVK